MRISVINTEGHHLTATERKHISYMLNNNLKEGQTKGKLYRLTLANDGVIICERWDWCRVHEYAKDMNWGRKSTFYLKIIK